MKKLLVLSLIALLWAVPAQTGEQEFDCYLLLEVHGTPVEIQTIADELRTKYNSAVIGQYAGDKEVIVCKEDGYCTVLPGIIAIVEPSVEI